MTLYSTLLSIISPKSAPYSYGLGWILITCRQLFLRKLPDYSIMLVHS